jgi:hypothetical protein
MPRSNSEPEIQGDETGQNMKHVYLNAAASPSGPRILACPEKERVAAKPTYLTVLSTA